MNFIEFKEEDNNSPFGINMEYWNYLMDEVNEDSYRGANEINTGVFRNEKEIEDTPKSFNIS